MGRGQNVLNLLEKFLLGGGDRIKTQKIFSSRRRGRDSVSGGEQVKTSEQEKIEILLSHRGIG